MKTIFITAAMICVLILGVGSMAMAGSVSNTVTVKGDTTNTVTGSGSGDKAIGITNSAINTGSGKIINDITVKSVSNTAEGEGAVGISNSAINSTSDTTTNIIDEGDGKVTNTAKKNAMAITNSAINGKMPQ